MPVITQTQTGAVPLFTTDNPPVGGQGGPAIAVIQTGPVDVGDDQQAQYQNVSAGDRIYTDYVVRSRYEKDGHIWMMGLTSPTLFQGASVSFVQLAAPTLLWICDWTASRAGSPPEVPSTNVFDPRWVLMDQLSETRGLTVVLADGRSPVYRISGTYVYGCLRPSLLLNQDMSFGRPPWLANTYDRQVPTGLFVPGLINQPNFNAGPGIGPGVVGG